MKADISKITEIRLTAFGNSDVGIVRENNEDRFYFDAEKGFFIVVDGMGGQQAGEKAAEIACETIKKRLERFTGNVAERIREAITLANNEIFRQANKQEEFLGMACVLTVAVIENNFVTVGHIGDSRLYLLTDEKIEKMTKDHSPIGVLEDNCRLTEIEAMRHPNRNEVFRDVGSQEHSPNDTDFIDIYEFPMPSESSLLICSDGLSDLLTSNQIFSLSQKHKENPQILVQNLINEANQAGGKDNITVLVVTNSAKAFENLRVIHETQEIVLSEELTEIKSQNTEKTTSPKLNLLKRIFFSRLAFMIYGSLITIIIFLAWKYFVEPQNLPLTN